MPRMELSESEVTLVKEHRRKTEIDRTHNAALDAMAEAAKNVVATIMESYDNSTKPYTLSMISAEIVQEIEAGRQDKTRHV